MNERDVLKRLGSGEPIDKVAADAGWSEGDFEAWWQEQLSSRVSKVDGAVSTGVSSEVRIVRDGRGIPHVLADNDEDLFFGFGMAMAQDRLFQLDYLRRKGLGRLAEILGPDGLEMDRVARTVGLNRIAEVQLAEMPEETRVLTEAFARGINAVIGGIGESEWPVEFDLLDYRPEPFTGRDLVAIETEFRWYLTGRFPIIVMPELARRRLGDGALLDDYLCGEEEQEAILPAGIWEVPPAGDPAGDSLPTDPVGASVGDPDQASGSNNWVAAGSRTVGGSPLVASDPHIAFEAVSCWYQVHLCGGSFDVAGMAYVGIPAVMFGRTNGVGWGITNNICSQRDLYQERTDAEHPDCFEFDGVYEPARSLVETIGVRDAEDVELEVRFSRNGPIVDELLPPPADRTGPVSLKWLGAYGGGWIEAMQAMDRAQTVSEFRQVMKPWHVPTFVLAIGDTAGTIAMQSTGRVPYRKALCRGYRRGWDPEDAWVGLIPYEAMPHAVDPERGWLGSANHRITDDSYPYRMFGCWSSGHRGRRIRSIFESHSGPVDRNEFARMQLDAVSGRAVECLGPLVEVLSGSEDPSVLAARDVLGSWDGDCLPESVGATLFNVFFRAWARRVAEVRFDEDEIELMSKGIEPAASRLLAADPNGWFDSDETRCQAIMASMAETVGYLEDRFGGELSEWTWERLHLMPLRHVLGGRGDLSTLLDHGGAGVRGDMTTVGNTGLGPDWEAASGAGYRHVVDLGDDPAGLWTVDGQGQSGQPGSPHYSDQYDDWLAGRLRFVPLGQEVEGVTTQRLVPEGG